VCVCVGGWGSVILSVSGAVRSGNLYIGVDSLSFLTFVKRHFLPERYLGPSRVSNKHTTDHVSGNTEVVIKCQHPEGY
jgi:hypothetical protein